MMDRKAKQIAELETRIKQLREAAAKRDKPEQSEQEGNKCQNVSNSSHDRG